MSNTRQELDKISLQASLGTVVSLLVYAGSVFQRLGSEPAAGHPCKDSRHTYFILQLYMRNSVVTAVTCHYQFLALC